MSDPVTNVLTRQGVSGAGKTSLLDALATRTTMGVVTGEMLVDGHQRDASFQRKTGYVQQQDLHLQTSTVREALNFSALLRQPADVPHAEKLAYVDEVIKLLDMEEYADAVVGVPGEGLNVEQRKRLTIGVELAAKPELLFFLDEPTSGLDSQTSWAICDLMEKLTKNGQAILCTIHQPSAMLFERFDRLLLLKTGGETVYFGDIGPSASTLISYFERNGGFACPKDANPAEWMLEVIGAAPGSSTDVDWFETWKQSPEYREVHRELDRIKSQAQPVAQKVDPLDKAQYSEFAAPFYVQMLEVQKRVFQQYWRTPQYIYSKAALCTFAALFIGFSFFHAPLSLQGLQNQMFAIFMLFTIFGQLVQQLMPHFVVQRALYEVRERPSKTYSWKAFMLSNIIVELPWQSLMAVIMYFCWYYPVGFYKNAEATNAVHERGALFFLLIWIFLVFTSTFAHMCIAAVETAEEGGSKCPDLKKASTNRGRHRQPPLRSDLDLLRCPRDADLAPRLLEVHVLRLALHLPRVGDAIDGRRQRQGHLPRLRAAALCAGSGQDVRRLHGKLRRHGRRLRREPERDGRLRLLHHQRHQRVPDGRERKVRGPLA
jgi:ABC-type multidrug transport system ATPase subunit